MFKFYEIHDEVLVARLTAMRLHLVVLQAQLNAIENDIDAIEATNKKREKRSLFYKLAHRKANMLRIHMDELVYDCGFYQRCCDEMERELYKRGYRLADIEKLKRELDGHVSERCE